MKKLLLLALVVLSAACQDKTRDMETRTFPLSRLNNDEALTLITPYVREGGYLTSPKSGRFITVREKADRMKVIEDVLKKYDGLGEAADVILDIRIVEANGFTTRDSALADVEQTLRETFRYRGYRLVGQTRVQTREGSGFRQSIGSGFTLGGTVSRLTATGSEQRVPIQVHLTGPVMRNASGLVTNASEMESTVTGVIGKPVVLGQSTGSGATILIITPTIAH